MNWIIWDTATNQQASVACFLSEASANRQIAAWKERQASGGRPDVDTATLVARKANPVMIHRESANSKGDK